MHNVILLHHVHVLLSQYTNGAIRPPLEAVKNENGGQLLH